MSALSIVIPAYNCADTITSSIEAILKQTFADFELIIVNDGSTDNTQAVLTSLAEADSRIKVITTPNQGPANARNIGAEAAVGDYIAFVDCDDFPARDMFEKMVECAKENDCDVVCCGYKMIQEKSGIATTFNYCRFRCNSNEMFLKNLTPLIKAHLMYVVWNKLYKRSFLVENKLRFEPFFSGEDRLFNIKSFGFINRFAVVDLPLYSYLLHENSLAGRFVENRFEAAVSCHKLLVELYCSHGLYDEKAASALSSEFVINSMAAVSQLYSKSCKLKLKEKRKYVKAIISDKNFKEALKHSDGALSLIINIPLRLHSVTITLLLGWGINLMQTKLNPLYLRIKHKKRNERQGA